MGCSSQHPQLCAHVTRPSGRLVPVRTAVLLWAKQRHVLADRREAPIFVHCKPRAVRNANADGAMGRRRTTRDGPQCSVRDLPLVRLLVHAEDVWYQIQCGECAGPILLLITMRA